MPSRPAGTPPQPTSDHPHISRRALARGVAWSTPAIVVATAAPAAAASPCGSRSYSPPRPGTTNDASAKTQTTWSVPAGVTHICATVVGGGGGNGYQAGGTVGGFAGQTYGRIRVTPGETLTFVVGAGGIGNSDVSATGGGGYGDGGSVATAPGSVISHGASGGGASALLRGTTPLMVAGGGGGSGNRRVLSSNGTNYLWLREVVGSGGDAGTAVPGGFTSNYWHNQATIRSTGNGGYGSTSGSAASAAIAVGYPPAPTGWSYNAQDRIGGLPGAAGFQATGAAGRPLSLANPATGTVYGVVSGAGGGGYGSGASGGLMALNATQGAVTTFELNIAAGAGGGGGNYIAAGISDAVISLSTNHAVSRAVRAPGSILVQY